MGDEGDGMEVGKQGLSPKLPNFQPIEKPLESDFNIESLDNVKSNLDDEIE